MTKDMIVNFWGVRGTLPVPGKKTIRYGGNTNCITLTFPKKHLFIFDAGTGIKELSNYLVKHHPAPIKAKIFLSHPHYDHINGAPFFVPFYKAGNEFEILGATHHNLTVEKLFSDQMDSIYFPITIKEFSAKVTFRTLTEETFFIDDIEVKTILLNHPGQCLGYRIHYKNKSFGYVTDNELYLEDSPNFKQADVDKLIEFIKNIDVLVIDSTYTDKDYEKKVSWGHSPISRVIEIAHQARVKLLCLYHHDPDQMDKDIAAKLKQARKLLKKLHSKTHCIAPKEGDKIFI